VKATIKPNLTVVLLLALFTFSCCPEDDSINPADYEMYITSSNDKYPAVSPDGSLIAYYHVCMDYPEPEDYPTGLYVMSADGANRRLLLKGFHFSPSWSPDGQWLVFTSGGTIQIISLEGDSIRTFQGINGVPLYSPDWSQDGKMILMTSPYVNGGGVFVTDPFFHKIRQLFDQFQFSGFTAQWFPYMDKIIYEKVSHDWEGGEIFMIDTLGISDIRITNDAKDDRESVLSNDGNLITWSRNVRIMIMNIDGSKQKTLGYGQYPSWLPSSDYIVYSFGNSDYTKGVLWRINIDGTNRTQLTF